MNPHDLDTAIATNPFLLGMSDRHVRLLAGCANRIHFDEGHIIFRQGETANRFYLIEAGTVQLEAAAESDGRAILVDTIGSGELLGWSWLFAPYEWQFTARALTEIEAIFFYGTVLREYCETDPSLGFELFKRMSEVMVKRLQSTRARLVKAETGFSPIGAEHAIEHGV